MTEALERPMLVDAGEIVAPESGRCGAELASGMDLGTLLRGERIVRSNDRLRLWLELSVLAHLVARPSAGISPALREELADLPLGVVKAAIGYGVDEAVASRSAAIKPRLSPAALAEHVGEQVWLHLENGARGDICDNELAWVAEPFLGILAVDPLLQGFEERNLHQLEQAQWSWATQHSRRMVYGTVLGDGNPTAIEHAIGARHSSEHWSAALRQAGDHDRIDPVVAGILNNLPR